MFVELKCFYEKEPAAQGLCKAWMFVLIAICGAWAQEDAQNITFPLSWDDVLEKRMSIAEALNSSHLSNSCVADFTNLLQKDNFSMAGFMKELPPAVAKVQVQLKSPFGKPKDSDMTSVGLTVGCIKALPESPTEIQSLLKDISLKAGLDFTTAVVAGVTDNSIPANVETNVASGGASFKQVASICLVTSGVIAIIYGISQNGKVSKAVEKRDGKAAVDAEKDRNFGYGLGAALLAGGLTIHFVF